MGISVIDQAANTLTYAAIGNIEIRVVGGGAPRLASNPGIIGGGYRHLSTQTAPLEENQLVIMFTDGVASRLDISGYDSSVRLDLQQLAERVIEDWGRETDDAAVLIFRYEGS